MWKAFGCAVCLADFCFTIDSFFYPLRLSFFRRLISELAEPNSTKIGHTQSEVTAIWKRMSKIWGIPSPYKPGPQNHLFSTTLQLNGNFNGPYLRKETRYRQSVKCVDNYKGSPTSSQMSRTLVHKRLKTRPAFLPTVCKLCILLHCHASQTEISKRNSTKLCQTVDGRSR